MTKAEGGIKEKKQKTFGRILCESWRYFLYLHLAVIYYVPIMSQVPVPI